MLKIMIVFIGLGSNEGDRDANLSRGVDALNSLGAVLKISSIYETEPWGYLNQNKFLNQVVMMESVLTPFKLLQGLKSIERQMGRRQTIRYGPRNIDLDILIYDNWVVDRPDLVIPHAEMHQRAFVLVPLCEIAPDLIHPRLQVPIMDLVKDVDTTSVKLWRLHSRVRKK